VPGTTRDILELSLDIGGLPVLVTDTAGLRETTDEVERIGIERAQKACVDLLFFFFFSFFISGVRSVNYKKCSGRRRIAPRARIPGRDLRDALGSSTRDPVGTRPARNAKHVHPAQQDGSVTSDVIRVARSARRRGSAVRQSRRMLGGQSRLAGWYGRVPRRARHGITAPVRRGNYNSPGFLNLTGFVIFGGA
jgi:hypothetical protein